MSDERTAEPSWDPSSSDSDGSDEEGQENLLGRSRGSPGVAEDDEDAAWAATRRNRQDLSESDEEDDKPWNNFRKTHRLTEIARWKKNHLQQTGLDEALVKAVRAYSARVVGNDAARINEPVDSSRPDLRQVGLDIFFLSDGYCVDTTNFDAADKFRAEQKKKEVEAVKKKRKASTPQGCSASDVAAAAASGSATCLDNALSRGGGGVDDTFAAPKVAARTSSSLAEQLRLAQARKSNRSAVPSSAFPTQSTGTTSAATASSSAPAGARAGFPAAASPGKPAPQFSACVSSSDDEDDEEQENATEPNGTGSNAHGASDPTTADPLPLPAAQLASFASAAVGDKWSFSLDSWGDDRSMDAFDDLLRQGWAMQLYAPPATSNSGSAAPRPPVPNASLDVSFSASWWQEGAQARVHRSASHATIALGERKCLPAVEEALSRVPVGMCAEIVVGPDNSAALSILGPAGVSSPADEGDYLVCRVHVHGASNGGK